MSPTPVHQTIVAALRRTEQPLTATQRRDIGRAACWLDKDAEELFRSYTMPSKPRQWTEHDAEHRRAHRDHDELRALAGRLRAMTKTTRRTK